MSSGLATWPKALEIRPLGSPPRATIHVPGSKSITNRALVLAALADGGCELMGALQCEDTEVMLAALEVLGFDAKAEWASQRIRVDHPDHNPIIPRPAAELFLGNSGTAMRFLAAALALGQGRYRLDGVARMRQRPIEDLLSALRSLGADAVSERGDGCPPIRIIPSGIKGGKVRIKGDKSSQFLSGLMMAAPRAEGDIEIHIEGPLVSMPYVRMTEAMVGEFGAEIRSDGGQNFSVSGRQRYRRDSYHIEPDATSAGYFMAAAAITGGRVTIPGYSAASIQGDWRLVDVLETMGCKIERGPRELNVSGGRLRGVDVDMNDISDAVMTLAAVACFADGPTRIRNVGHVRHKESHRLLALATELNRLGASVAHDEDGLSIQPGCIRGTLVQTYDDHRMAMSLSLIGLRVPGVVIENPACVAKTYPCFFTDLNRLYEPEGALR